MFWGIFMERFAWDIDYIMKRQEYYKNLWETAVDEAKREEYEILFDTYSRLILERLSSEGAVTNSGISCLEILEEIREYPLADDYSPYSLKIRDSIIKEMHNLTMNLPYVQFSKSTHLTNLVNYVGEAIHDLFGDEAYEDYKKLALDKNSNIQIGNSESRAGMTLVNDPDYPNYYILLPKHSNISIVGDLAHEAGHHHRYMVNDRNLLADHLLSEYESFSYALRVLDYFIKNGIYKREAIKAMIRQINFIDTCALLFDELDLLNSHTICEFTREAHKRDLYDRIHIPNNRLLLDHLFTIKTEYMFPYIYSALCVFDHMQTDPYLDRYETVIRNIGRIPEEELIKKVVDKPEDINNLNGYKKYREDIKRLYKGE